MNLHKLHVFCEVVERQSLTEAAEFLVVTQPVVSAHISDLERFFGAKLLQRQHGCMVPTEAGQAVYEYALRVLRETDEISSRIQALQRGDAGEVRVGANVVPGTYILPPLLTAFKLRHPRAEISLSMSDPSSVCERLHEGRYEFAVLTEAEPPAGVHRELLMQAPVVIVCQPGHPLGSRSLVRLSELAEEAWVCRPYSGRRRPVIDALLRSIGLTHRRVEMALSHSEGIKHAVAAGVGIAAMFRCSVEAEIRCGALIELAVDCERLELPIYLLHHAQKRFSPVQRQLLDFILASTRPGHSAGAPSVFSPPPRSRAHGLGMHRGRGSGAVPLSARPAASEARQDGRGSR
ncbi:MAG: LysR family transcriptional regulator [Chloroflexi bacterium]|nr:LysR family transcriptional regulator [Chloroflexota bacterium]